MRDLLIGCDWGSSSFRLALIDLSSGKILQRICTEDGVVKTAAAGNDGPSAFTEVLSLRIRELEALQGEALTSMPVVISGMASSSIGMKELPYAKLPFRIDGSDVVGERLEEYILLISGVASSDDVMRGEETQLIGLADSLASGLEATFIFPGTHSKHVAVVDGAIAQFKTYMSGELFDLLRKHSLLSNSVELGALDDRAFVSGVRASKDEVLLNRLFSVRTNQLFGIFDKNANASYLSGLIIGEELKALRAEQGQIVFCCDEKFSGPYRLAAEELDLGDRAAFLPTALVENAVFHGHHIIYEKFRKS